MRMELSRIEELARKAAVDRPDYVYGDEDFRYITPELAAFMDACDPQAVLSIIDRLRTAEQKADRLPAVIGAAFKTRVETTWELLDWIPDDLVGKDVALVELKADEDSEKASLL